MNSSTEENLSIVPQDTPAYIEEIFAETTLYSEPPPTWWEEIASPWTLAALLMLLGSNTLLSLAQAPAPQQAPPQPVVRKDFQPKNPLSLNNLSQVSLPLTPKPLTAQVIPQPPQPKLSQALLPPASQPQWLPIAPPPAPTPVVIAPSTPPPAPTPVVIAPSTPPPAPVVSQKPKPQPQISPDLLRERILEEMRLRSLPPAPESFHERTKKTLLEAQQRSQPAQPSPNPAVQPETEKKIPRSIIIDNTGAQVGY